MERRRPDVSRISTHISHPPMTFQLKRFEPGILEAIGYIGGREAARHVVRTPGTVERLELRLDEEGRPFAEAGGDVAFLHAEMRDSEGTAVPGAWENVFFGSTGHVELVGVNPFSSEAGIASILVKAETSRPAGAVYALCPIREGEQVRVLSAVMSRGGDVERHDIRYTTDGSAPGPESPVYEGPLSTAERVRATLFVGGRPIVEADTHVARFRVPGSTAPA
jgi:hypothetical protein